MTRDVGEDLLREVLAVPVGDAEPSETPEDVAGVAVEDLAERGMPVVRGRSP